MTDRTYQNAFILDKISSIDACANQKTITEACKFNTIKYVQSPCSNYMITTALDVLIT